MIDNYSRYEMYEDELYRRAKHFPVCVCCGERILSEWRYRINGEYWCENCVEELRESNDEMYE